MQIREAGKTPQVGGYKYILIIIAEHDLCTQRPSRVRTPLYPLTAKIISTIFIRRTAGRGA